jgi:hypothetical protein
MHTERRSFLSMIVMTLAGVRALFAGQQGQWQSPRMPEIPDASGSRSHDDDPISRKRNLNEHLKENQKNLRSDADHLLQLARELKDEADKTEQREVLSISLIHRAEEIEKLARQIKGLARSA